MKNIERGAHVLTSVQVMQRHAVKDLGRLVDTVQHEASLLEVLDSFPANILSRPEKLLCKNICETNWDKFEHGPLDELTMLAMLADQRDGFDLPNLTTPAGNATLKTCTECRLSLTATIRGQFTNFVLKGAPFSDKDVAAGKEMDPMDFWRIYGVGAATELVVHIMIPLLSMTDGASGIERINSSLAFINSKRRVRLGTQKGFLLAKVYINRRALVRAKKLAELTKHPRVTLEPKQLAAILARTVAEEEEEEAAEDEAHDDGPSPDNWSASSDEDQDDMPVTGQNEPASDEEEEEEEKADEEVAYDE
ncbi:hypothetical protein T492DRAFT_1144443, partial [Pavlovales sp. CCMP2436]